MLFVALVRFGLRLAFFMLRRGVLGRNLESIVSLGGRLISLALVIRVHLLSFSVVGFLPHNGLRQIRAELIYLGCSICHECQLLLDLRAVIRCRVGRLRRRWND